MVNLKFTVTVRRSVDEVFGYFSRFQTISEWDPNVLSAKLVKHGKDHVGDEYDLLTVWKGDQSHMTYIMTEYEHLKKIVLVGQNDKVRSKDTMIFEPGAEPGTTNLTYKASIELKGFLKVFTVFILSDLNKLAEDSKVGLLKRCKQLFE